MNAHINGIVLSNIKTSIQYCITITKYKHSIIRRVTKCNAQLPLQSK